MRRADRLFQIVQILRQRGRRAVTAATLAEALEVSERTVYRDIRDLVLSGVPIDGEAGVGYAMAPGYDLPPLMFTHEEIEALVLGARIVRSWSDPALAKAAQDALGKIEVALPDQLRARVSDAMLFAPKLPASDRAAVQLSTLRRAIHDNHKVRVGYSDRNGAATSRTLWPLGLFFWGSTWTLGAWCELRQGFRNFRLDRIERLVVLDEVFRAEAGQTLEDYLRAAEEDAAACDAPDQAATRVPKGSGRRSD